MLIKKITGFFVVMICILLLTNSVVASEPYDSYVLNQGVGDFGFFTDAERYEFGDVMKITYAIKSKFKDGKDLKVNVYRLHNYSSLSNDSQDPETFCYLYPEKTLIKSVNIPPTTKNEVYQGSIDIELNSTNGFSPSLIDPTYDLYAQNRFQQQSILITISDPNRTMIDYEYLGPTYDPCHWDARIDFFLDPQGVSRPDLIVENVSIQPRELSSINEKFVITYTVKNIGEVSSTERVKVCLTKRNLNFGEPIYSPNEIIHNNICHNIDPLASGGIEVRFLEFDPNRDKFGVTYIDRESKNDVLTYGENRLALVINGYDLKSGEESYLNNETVFFLNVIDPSTVVPVDQGLKEGDLIKSPIHPAVYKYENGKRRSFPNGDVYHTWYNDFMGVKSITVAEMEAIPLGNPMSIKPKVGLVKFPYNPKVYEILSDGVMKHLPNEDAARNAYGLNWGSKVITLPEIYSLFYSVAN